MAARAKKVRGGGQRKAVLRTAVCLMREENGKGRVQDARLWMEQHNGV